MLTGSVIVSAYGVDIVSQSPAQSSQSPVQPICLVCALINAAPMLHWWQSRPAPLSPLISSLSQSWGSGIWSVNTDTGCDPSMNGHTHVELSWSYQTRRERVNSRWGNQSKLRWLVTIQGDKTLKWVKWPTVIRWGRYIVSYPCFHCPRLPSEQQPKMWTK